MINLPFARPAAMRKSFQVSILTHALALWFLNVTHFQPWIELPAMLWSDHSSIRRTLLIEQSPQLSCSHFWWVLVQTTRELRLWKSFPAAALRRSALSGSIVCLLLRSPIQCHFHPCALLNVVFLSLPSGDKCPLWLNSSFIVPSTECPLRKSNDLHF